MTVAFSIEMMQIVKWISNQPRKITTLIYNLEQWKERFSEKRVQSNSLEIAEFNGGNISSFVFSTRSIPPLGNLKNYPVTIIYAKSTNGMGHYPLFQYQVQKL